MIEPPAIVVVIHDSARELGLLLASIDRHLPARPQVVVVDTLSSDRGAELARDWGAEVIEQDRNAGFGAANNAGVARVRASVCALLNPDVELLDDGLLGLAARAAAYDALHAPRLLNADGSVQRSAHPLPGTVRALIPALLPPGLLPARARLAAEPWRAAQGARPVGWAIAAALVARTATLDRLGPFQPRSFLFYEDLELCLRARAAGVPTLLQPDITLRHSGGHSTARAYGGEPHRLLARRRREVVREELGERALALDDAAQALTFTGRAAARIILRRDSRRERAQLQALRRARAGAPRD
ncbi:MAG: hypothetical protein NVSMB51_17190 [Solirubrobacteraceae bacterium]